MLLRLQESKLKVWAFLKQVFFCQCSVNHSDCENFTHSLSSRGMAWCVKTNCVNSLALSILLMRSIIRSLSLIRLSRVVQSETPALLVILKMSSKFAETVAAEFVLKRLRSPHLETPTGPKSGETVQRKRIKMTKSHNFHFLNT